MGIGEAYSPNTGSVITVSPANSSSAVECPSQVTARSPGRTACPRAGRSTAKTERSGSGGGRRMKFRSTNQRTRWENPRGLLPGQGFW